MSLPHIENLELMRVIDQAWNERNWEKYASLLDDDLIAFISGERGTHNKAEHIKNAMDFCKLFPDVKVDAEPYEELFSNPDKNTTCSIARLKGTMTNPMAMPDGTILEPNNSRFDIPFCVVNRWRQGRIFSQFEFVDTVSMLKQLRNH